MRLPCGPVEIGPCNSVGTAPVAAGLLARPAEIADLHRLRRIAEVVDLGHAPEPPARDSGDEVGDAGVALPPVLVRVLESARRPVVTSTGFAGSVTSQISWASPPKVRSRIDLARVALGQRLAIADAHHLRRRPPRLCPRRPGMCARYFGCLRIGHVDDRRAVEFRLARSAGSSASAPSVSAVMTDIGDVTVALLVDRSAGTRCGLQIVVADEPHVLGFRRIADLGRLRDARWRQDHPAGDRPRITTGGR